MNRIVFLRYLLLAFVLLQGLACRPVFAQTGFVQGSFCSLAQGNSPAPGLLVSLVHPQFGRSAPVFTDNYGNFVMANVPMSPVPYYIEVYWGQNLIYRNLVIIGGLVQLPRVCL